MLTANVPIADDLLSGLLRRPNRRKRDDFHLHILDILLLHRLVFIQGQHHLPLNHLLKRVPSLRLDNLGYAQDHSGREQIQRADSAGLLPRLDHPVLQHPHILLLLDSILALEEALRSHGSNGDFSRCLVTLAAQKLVITTMVAHRPLSC